MSAEKDAWLRLQQLGRINASDFFSPSKAQDGFYTNLLRETLSTPLEVDEEGIPIANPVKSLGEALVELENRAEALLDDGIAHGHRLIHLREAASDLGLNVRDGELRRVLADAKRRIAGVTESIGNRPLSLSPVPWLVDGLLLRGGLNLIIAPPKIGKTSLIISLLSQWAHGSPTFLGQSINEACPPILIVGPDMPERDWAQMLNQAGLLTPDMRLKPPLVDLFTAGQPLQLDEPGIERIARFAHDLPGLLVVMDSLAAVTRQLGLSENDPEIALPVSALMEALEPYGGTPLLVHHSNKGRIGDSPSLASRGSTALPALASQTIALTRFSECPNAQEGKRDRRVVLRTEGRGGMPLELLVERVDAHWVCHGNAEAMQMERHFQEVEKRLNDRQIDVLSLVRDRWGTDGLPTDAMEVVQLLGLKPDAERVMRRTLDQLVSHGLLASEIVKTDVSRRKVWRPIGHKPGGVFCGVSALPEVSGRELDSVS